MRTYYLSLFRIFCERVLLSFTATASPSHPAAHVVPHRDGFVDGRDRRSGDSLCGTHRRILARGGVVVPLEEAVQVCSRCFLTMEAVVGRLGALPPPDPSAFEGMPTRRDHPPLVLNPMECERADVTIVTSEQGRAQLTLCLVNEEGGTMSLPVHTDSLSIEARGGPKPSVTVEEFGWRLTFPGKE
jgi:hypothetical protein